MRLAFHSLPPKGLGSHLHTGVSLDGLDLCSVFLVMLVCAFIPLLVVLWFHCIISWFHLMHPTCHIHYCTVLLTTEPHKLILCGCSAHASGRPLWCSLPLICTHTAVLPLPLCILMLPLLFHMFDYNLICICEFMTPEMSPFVRPVSCQSPLHIA